MKKCPGCSDPRPVFGGNKATKGGLSFYCKRCRAADQRAFVNGNRKMYDRMRARNREASR